MKISYLRPDQACLKFPLPSLSSSPSYVQFEEYSSFVRAMDEFRSTKLVRKFVDKTQAININVNFDKQKHLSDSHVQRRERMRKRCIAKAQAEDEEREKEKKRQLEQMERERFDISCSCR